LVNNNYFRDISKSKFLDFFAANTLNESIEKHLKFKLAHLLRFEDKNSMAFSIETRLPFLDYQLVEYLVSLPAVSKIDKGATKAILRRAMTGILPESILNRSDKIGFETPEAIWLKNKKIKKWVYGTLNTKEFRERKIYNQKKVDKLLRKYLREDKINTQLIWNLFCLELWFKKFID
jgi:asparagine synthase (glutamine-hydrolysing)